MADESEVSEVERAEFTGRFIIVFNEGMSADDTASEAGMRMAHSAEFSTGSIDVASVLGEADAVYFDELKIAVSNAPPTQIQHLGVRAGSVVPAVTFEPERWVYPAEELALQRVRIQAPAADAAPGIDHTRDYMRGYRDASSDIYARLFGGGTEGSAEVAITPSATALWSDTAALTWGLQATRADRSTFTGRGVRVAILDTGFTANHPDFTSRPVNLANFVTGEPGDDLNGHGTHCTGTAFGPARPSGTRRRYGVAGEAEIFNGKVLALGGSGDGVIIAGIDWALRNGCRVISMSLSAPTRRGQAHSAAFEIVARRSMSRGALIVAAAGNDSSRPGRIDPVGHPANCPSIMAVAAIDRFAKIASFSNGSVNTDGRIDIAGPGVDVFSAWRLPLTYRSIPGTSMATPHVAGVAAQYLQRNSGLTPQQLWTELQANARRFPSLPGVDVGAGLVQSV